MSEKVDLANGLVFRPLPLVKLTISLLVVMQTFFLFCGLWACVQNHIGVSGILYRAIVGILTFGSGPFYMHSMRNYIREYDELRCQITEFSIESAYCYSQTDRELVYDTVRLWFKDLDKFNGFVRREVANEIMAAIPRPGWFPLRLSGCMMAPVFFFGLDWIVYYVHLHESSPELAVCGVIQLSLYAIQLELLQTLALQLANRPCIKKRRSGSGSGSCRDWLVSIVMGEVLALLMVALYLCSVVLLGMHPAVIAVYAVVLLGVALILRWIGARSSRVD